MAAANASSTTKDESDASDAAANWCSCFIPLVVDGGPNPPSDELLHNFHFFLPFSPIFSCKTWWWKKQNKVQNTEAENGWKSFSFLGKLISTDLVLPDLGWFEIDDRFKPLSWVTHLSRSDENWISKTSIKTERVGETDRRKGNSGSGNVVGERNDEGLNASLCSQAFKFSNLNIKT